MASVKSVKFQVFKHFQLKSYFQLIVYEFFLLLHFLSLNSLSLHFGRPDCVLAWLLLAQV